MTYRPRSAFPAMHIIVANTVAQWFSTPPFRANTSAMQTFNVFPDRTTLARATNSSPSAGASKFILYSTVSTESSAPISVNAAYPQALSAIAPVTPA